MRDIGVEESKKELEAAASDPVVTSVDSESLVQKKKKWITFEKNW